MTQAIGYFAGHPIVMEFDPATGGYFPVFKSAGSSSSASGEVIGTVGTPTKYFEVTPTLMTGAYASGDVLFTETVVLEDALRESGGSAWVFSVIVQDDSDQKQALDLVFMNSNTSLGTVHEAVSISDADAVNIQGFVSIATTDYIDLGGTSLAILVAGKDGMKCGLLQGVIGSPIPLKNLFVAGISRGSGSYAASGLKLRIGIIQN